MKDDLMQFLQASLRADYSPESLMSEEQKQGCKRLLLQKAIDHDIETNIQRTDDERYKIIDAAIERFLSNWNSKQHGDDPRGKTSLGHIASAIMDSM